jgi:hypothetical protein
MNRANRPRLSRVSGSSYDSRVFSRAGDGSTLSLDFTTGVLDSRLTFTRTTTATYINSQGYVTTMAAAPTNDPTKARFDYDPTTTPPTPRGLLIEGSASNLFNWSETFATSGGVQNWQTPENATLGTLTTSPRNASDAYPINETTTNSVHRLQTYSFSGLSGAYSLSVWAKCVDTNTPRRLYINANTALGAGALFDLTATGTSGNAVNVSGTAGNRAGTWVAYPNGWYRCTLIGTRAADGTIYLQINRSTSITASDDSFAGSTSNGIIMWGAQLETGSGASSYIPTGASQGNRAADDCLLDNISTAFNFNASEGTILVKYGNRVSTGSMRSYTFLPASGATNQIFESSGTALNAYSSGSFVAQIGATNASGARVCAAYKLDDYAVSVNGGTVATDTSGAVPSSLTRLSIGGSAVNSAAYNYGPISLFKYWPTRLSNAQLQDLTT